MTDPDPRNRAFYWSALFFRELFHKGITQVVISPGSRSAPLTLAAASHPGLNKQVVLDERSAAWLALGIGKATGIPAVCICTSGTALANYYPAVIESRLSGIPLILATADRPPHLRNTGANQTIDQLKIFGDYPVFFHEAGEPVHEDKDLSRLTMLAGQAMDAAVRQKGPVHLNFPFRNPLEPLPSFVSIIEKENRSLAKQKKPRTEAVQPSRCSLPSDIIQLIQQAEYPLIITAPLPASTGTETIRDLAETIQAPVLSEGGFNSPCNICGYDGFLHDEKIQEGLTPDLILRFGFRPTSMALEQALTKWTDIPHIHFSGPGNQQDAAFPVSHRVDWPEIPVEWNMNTGGDTIWLDKWKSTEKKFTENISTLIKKERDLTDLHVYHHLTPQIPKHWSVFLSNSFPVRDSLLAGRYQTPSVFVNRGASGIDGITSTAMGINIALNRPTILFTGDLAFLHDTNALLSNHLLQQPMIIVVLNNRGGNIFRMLPVAGHKSYYRDYFETPQSAEISAMAETYGVSYIPVTGVDTLGTLDLSEIAEKKKKGVHIVECKTHSESSMKLRNAIRNRAYET